MILDIIVIIDKLKCGSSHHAYESSNNSSKGQSLQVNEVKFNSKTARVRFGLNTMDQLTDSYIFTTSNAIHRLSSKSPGNLLGMQNLESQVIASN